jgi:orotidine-5'-phosphate decarboxylase
LPGYGAQGASAEDVVPAFDDQGQGALVSASRSLTFPWAKEGAVPANWENRILSAVAEMHDDLARVLR